MEASDCYSKPVLTFYLYGLSEITQNHDDTYKRGTVVKTVKLGQCGGCKRSVRAPVGTISNGKMVDLRETTCGQEALERGPGQKVTKMISIAKVLFSPKRISFRSFHSRGKEPNRT